MALPVTGPYSQNVVGYGNPYTDMSRQWWRQAKPFDRPLEYTRIVTYGRSVDTSGNANASSTSVTKYNGLDRMSFDDYDRVSQATYNAAYAKLKDKVGNSAGWGENIAQINKSRRLIVQRSMQLASFAGLLRKGDFVGAAKRLRTPVPSRVSHRKAVSQNFLEFEYGIKPLVSDIKASVDLLTSTPGWGAMLRGAKRGEVRRNSYSRTNGSFGSFSSNRVSYTGWVGHTVRARVFVNNPDLFLANQLGLIDLALPWKLIPFSFVVDWFVNVEQVISSLTDWYGCTLQHPHRTEIWRGSGIETYRQFDYTWNVPGPIFFRTRDRDLHFERVERRLGIPSPVLVMKPFKGFSVTRGAQAISLVLSVLGK